MCIEYSPRAYIESKASLLEKIVAIEAIIDANLLAIADHAAGAGAGVSMYELDDGQARIKTNYRSVDAIIAGNTALEKMKQIYVNRYNGRTYVLRDRSTLRGFGGCRIC